MNLVRDLVATKGYTMIKTFRLERSPIFHLREAEYSYNKDGRFPRLQRLCFALLAKLGSRINSQSRQVETIRIPLRGNLANQLLELASYIEAEHSVKLGRIYMGWDEWVELSEQCYEDRRPALVSYTQPDDRKFREIPVTVLPWMQGTLVVPQHKGEAR